MRVPKHIGIIPDGNRRWAVNNNCLISNHSLQEDMIMESILDCNCLNCVKRKILKKSLFMAIQ